jgi:hypothetical protein|tara:strand:- start:999 stop:1262 length:264 start_codon:yes stop_codon:yes gene_type:complete
VSGFGKRATRTWFTVNPKSCNPAKPRASPNRDTKTPYGSTPVTTPWHRVPTIADFKELTTVKSLFTKLFLCVTVTRFRNLSTLKTRN